MQIPKASDDPGGQVDTHVPLVELEHLWLRHWVPFVQGCRGFRRQAEIEEMKVLPGWQTHAFVTADQVAPDPAAHVQE